MHKLIIQTILTAIIATIAFGVLLFLPAWTFNYWQAWVFIAIFCISANAIGIYLSLKDPVLLERRKKVGPAAEQSTAQKIIASLIIIGFFGLLVFSAFAHRFGWSPAPAYVSLAGDVLVALGFLMNYFVLKANSYSASTIRTFADQTVISTGPYAMVRHPMYAGTLVMIIGIPPALGSWLGLVLLALIIPVLIWRILDEEKLLEQDLPGYTEYQQKVRYRLVPYLW